MFGAFLTQPADGDWSAKMIACSVWADASAIVKNAATRKGDFMTRSRMTNQGRAGRGLSSGAEPLRSQQQHKAQQQDHQSADQF